MENEHSRKLQSAIKLTDPSPFSPVSFHHRKKEKKKEEISDLSCHDVQPVESRRPFSFFISAPFASSSGEAFIQTPLRVLRGALAIPSRSLVALERSRVCAPSGEIFPSKSLPSSSQRTITGLVLEVASCEKTFLVSHFHAPQTPPPYRFTLHLFFRHRCAHTSLLSTMYTKSLICIILLESSF